jgi:hypothetical protein
MVRHRLVAALYWLPALPPLIVTMAMAIVAGGEIAGSHPLTAGPPRGVAEAIAMHDAAAAARLVEGGASASEVGVIRPGILGDRAVLATPLETAVILDQVATVDFLASHGAQRSAALACLAVDVGARSVRSRLGDPEHCRAGEALREVLARP